MVALVEALALGKSKEKSKTGKYHYLFVNGIKRPDGLLDKFSAIDFWAEVDEPIKVNEKYQLLLDINGENVQFIEFK